jgi:hypothetical protein
MILWRFVLSADDELDLADPERGRGWFARQPWMPTTTDECGNRSPSYNRSMDGEWDLYWRQGKWSACVLTLRSLARRWGHRTKRPCPTDRISQLRADRLATEYVVRVVHSPIQKPRLRGKTQPFNRKNFFHLAGRPTRMDDRGFLTLVAQPFDFWYLLSVFWQSVFFSFFSGETQPYCERCGNPIERTPQGKLSKRRWCRACAFPAWKAKQTPEYLREKWKREKQRQRNRDKENGNE